MSVFLLLQSTGFGTTDQSGASTATAASLVDEARALLTYSGQYQAIEYTSEEHFTRCVTYTTLSLDEAARLWLRSTLLLRVQCKCHAALKTCCTL